MMECKWTFLTRLLLLTACLGTGRSAIAATTRYVNGAHGSDSNLCKSATTACKTVGHAISLSNSGDAIIVAAGTYPEHLSIAISLTIVGASAPTTIIDGGHSAAVVTVSNAGAQVALSQLTLRNGQGLTHGGGGIYNVGTLLINDVTVSGNSSNDTVAIAGGLGGGIYNAGTIGIIQSTISGNYVTRFRMGSSGAGGGIYNTGRLVLTNSTVSGNQAADYWPAAIAYGGGIANEGGTASINNSTISQNGALIHTPFGTAGTYGGGIENMSTAVLQNSIVANNSYGGDCHGNVSSSGHNLSSDVTCSLNGAGDQRNTNPRLGPLQNNGGSTQTMALLVGSPAIDAGNPSGCTNGNGKRLLVDERGHSRPNPGACDVGAYNH